MAEGPNVIDLGADPIFKPLGRKNAYEEVTEEIRRLIHQERLQPLHRLPTERSLAEQFGVSRMVIREAIRTLERAGLLAVRKGPTGGIFVAQDYDRPISDLIGNLLAGGEASLENLFEIRLLIEPYAASRSAELGSDADFLRLEALITQAEAGWRQGVSPRPHNIEFHRVILRMSRNPIMIVMGEAVLSILSDRIKGVTSPDTSQRALDMHRNILIALRKRQSNKARVLMEKDIAAAEERLVSLGPEALLRLAAGDGF